jgi:hypothetical protein
LIGILSDAGQAISNIPGATYDSAKNYITAPIPALVLEKALDDLVFLTAKDFGGLAFDTATGMALSYIGGEVFGWVAGKGWQVLSGPAAEMAESYLKKLGLMPGIIEDGPKKLPAGTNQIRSPIDFDHTIGADYTKTGKPTGGHTLLNGDVKIVPGTESIPDASGVYKATVQVPDPKNPGQWITKTSNNSTNTMFPKTWDEVRLKSEIDAAWNSPNKIVTGDKWISVTPSGVKVEGFISPKITVYPIYQTPK